MADRHVCVVAFDATTAASLLSLVPATISAQLYLVGSDVDALPVDVRELAFTQITAVVCESLEPEVTAAAVRETVDRFDIVLLGSDQRSRDLAGWLSVTEDLPLVWAIDAIRVDAAGVVEADRIVLGGSHRLVHQLDASSPVLICAKPTGRSAIDHPVATPAQFARVDPAVPSPRVRVVASVPAGQEGVSLTGARAVISVGRGIGGPEAVDLYRQLADRLGAALGASRVVVDSGWLPFRHQVGQTGTAVSPDVYAAFGISGAIQHLAGMRGSKRVIAINTDLEAPICSVADVVINADANEVAKALLDRSSAH